MNLTLLVVYHRLITFCQRNKMHNGDCIILVSEEAESLSARPVSLTDDDSTDSYFEEMVAAFRQGSLKDMIHVEQTNTVLLQNLMRQLRSRDVEKGLHIFTYLDGNLMVITRDGMAALSDV